MIASTNPYFGIKAIGAIQKELGKRKWKRLQDDLYYLKRRGFIEVNQNPDGTYSVAATATGKNHAKKYELDDIAINTSKKWDGRWRLVIFDIPANRQKSRSALLLKLKELGFIMLQRSIWAHPFECQSEVAVLARAFEVDRYVQYLTCNSVSAGDYLRREFEKRNCTKLI